MAGEFLYGVSESLLFLGAIGLLYGGAEIGYRYALRTSDATSERIQSHVATVEGALLGLLALLLGFAFAMAMSRYDARKQVVLEEVNDLETTFLRAHLLPISQSGDCVAMLNEYLESRIAYLRAGADAGKIAEAQGWSRRLQGRLWSAALKAARENPDEVTSGYFVESLNHLIDDHTKRTIAMENHVPEVIYILLILVAALTIAVTGYSSGLRRRRLRALRVILILLVTATLTVIIDLDRPRRGLIRIGEEGLVRLQQDFPEFHREAVEPGR